MWGPVETISSLQEMTFTNPRTFRDDFLSNSISSEVRIMNFEILSLDSIIGNPLTRQIREIRTSRDVFRRVSRLSWPHVSADPRCWRFFPTIGAFVVWCRSSTARRLAAPCGAASQGFHLARPDNADKFETVLPVLFRGEMFGEDVSALCLGMAISQGEHLLSVPSMQCSDRHSMRTFHVTQVL